MGLGQQYAIHSTLVRMLLSLAYGHHSWLENPQPGHHHQLIFIHTNANKLLIQCGIGVRLLLWFTSAV